MHLVDDIHLAPASHGRVLHLFAQVAHFVDAVVGRRVYFDDIHIGWRREGAADGALAAGRAVAGVLAVYRTGEYFGERSLARAARTAEEIGMPDLARIYLVFENSDYVLLPDDFIEGRGAECAVKRQICHLFSSSQYFLQLVF